MQVFDLVLKNEERRCYFARGGKVTKTPPGDGFVSTFAQRVLTGGLSPDPYLRGTPSCFLGQFRPAGKI